MSIFGSLMDKLRGRAARKQEEKINAAVAANAPAAATPSVNATPAATTALDPVDIEAVLTEMANENDQKLDWRHSIVDLMKLTGIDSSLSNRKELAAELGYTGSTDDSAAMNVWLHKQVMKKMSENGGIVPASLLD